MGPAKREKALALKVPIIAETDLLNLLAVPVAPPVAAPADGGADAPQLSFF